MKIKDKTEKIEKAEKNDKGKIKWHLLDQRTLEDTVKVLEFGAKKYDKDNWKKGLYTSQIYDSIKRHLDSFMSGIDYDGESNLPHIAHIQANLMFLTWMLKNKREFDDRKI